VLATTPTDNEYFHRNFQRKDAEVQS
jgi:hypothetical protein